MPVNLKDIKWPEPRKRDKYDSEFEDGVSLGEEQMFEACQSAVKEADKEIEKQRCPICEGEITHFKHDDFGCWKDICCNKP